MCANDRGKALTQSEKLIWAGQKLAPDSPLYNMALRFDLHGSIDFDRFEAALQSVIDRSDSLRTIYLESGGEGSALIRDALPAAPEFIDLSSQPQAEQAAAELIAGRSARRFDLSDRSFDMALIKLASDHFVWYFNQHHIATDAWSTSLVYREVAAAYQQITTEGASLEHALPAFAEHRNFEQSQHQRDSFQKTRQYWAGRRNPSNTLLRPYGAVTSNRESETIRIPCRLGHERTRRITELAALPYVRTLSPEMTVFNLFAAAYAAFLSRVSGQSTIVFGAPAHNRANVVARETIGLFMEVFPLEIQVEPGDTFRSLLDNVRGETQSFLRHAVTGGSTAVDARTIGALLNFIHARFGDFGESPCTAEWIHPGHGDPRHLIRLQVHDFSAEDDYLLYFDLNTASFPEETRNHIPSHFLAILDALLDDNEQPIEGVALTTPAEIESISKRLAPPVETESAKPNESEATGGTFLDRFETQVRNHPNRIAVREGASTSTYNTLSCRALAVAHAISAGTSAANERVAICLPRGTAMVEAVLGAFYAGAAWVPIDQAYPDERIRFILDDIRSEGRSVQLITTRAWADRFDPFGAEADLLIIEDLSTNSLRSTSGNLTDTDIPLPVVVPSDPAYAIYTSGSTGQPKGVLVDHAGLLTYVDWARQSYADDITTRSETGTERPPAFPLCTPLTFDLTITSIFTPLSAGGEIVCYPDSKNAADLTILDVIEDDAVDVLKLTPSHLALFADHALGERRLQRLIVGGENLTSELALRVYRAFDGKIEIFNEYGPTEAVVGCMIHRFDPVEDTAPSVPIGLPAHGRQIYLLDAGSNWVPDGVPGEIFIAGRGLATGYLNRNEETALRFLDAPVASVPRSGIAPNTASPSRAYRSGDRARTNARGQLVYLGREDEQLKIQGVRIEPAEIIRTLESHPEIAMVALEPIRLDRRVTPAAEQYCTRCGLASNYPESSFDEMGVCNLCTAFNGYQHRVEEYFGSIEDLASIFETARPRSGRDYDCLVLLSGGKDSTYALHRVVGMGQRVLAATLDNGFISEGAKENARRTVEALGVDHVFMRTPAMNEIFVDSLKRHSNVCQGCFKTIYTLATQIAVEKQIPLVVTGLSRGQLFETRLTAELFSGDDFSVEQVDRGVLEARKAYHRVDDAALRLLDTAHFENEDVFTDVQFVDFYRYCNVSLDEMLHDLREKLPWVRPSDTGRSTNCLINDAGIFIHKRKEGFHNYALPYSWDVRVGHKNRDECLDELDDAIDPRKVAEILDEIGYDENLYFGEGTTQRLAAYFVAERPLNTRELSDWLKLRLPTALIPSFFIQMDQIPLTPHGKIDRAALPAPTLGRPAPATIYSEPLGELEKGFAEIWKSVLRVPRIGRHDNYFDVGGDSISAIRILARIVDSGYGLTPADLFEHQTIADLAAHAKASGKSAPNQQSSADNAENSGKAAKPFGLLDNDARKLDQLSKLLNRKSPSK